MTQRSFIPVDSQLVMYDAMLADYRDFLFRQTGDTPVVSEADGASIIFEVVAKQLHDLLTTGDKAGLANLPGPDSPYLADFLNLMGITIGANETNAQAWARRDAELQQPSLASPTALRTLLLAIAGVADVSFRGRANTCDTDVKVVSSQTPPTGQPQGIPTTGLITTVATALNAPKAAHIEDVFHVSAPTPIRYSVYAEVYYDAGARPDTSDFEAEVSEAYQAFVRSQRILGQNISITNLNVSSDAINGLYYTQTGLFAGDPTTGVGDQILTIAPSQTPAEWYFFTCEDTVNIITAQSAATQYDINLKFMPITGSL